MSSPTDEYIPHDSAKRVWSKRGLPSSMQSTYEHGHISGHPRTTAQQKAFDQAKSRILRTMNAEQIETAYWETVSKVNTILEEDQKKKEEIQREIDKLTAQRDLERRIFKKQKEEKERRLGESKGEKFKEEGREESGE